MCRFVGGNHLFTPTRHLHLHSKKVSRGEKRRDRLNSPIGSLAARLLPQFSLVDVTVTRALFFCVKMEAAGFSVTLVLMCKTLQIVFLLDCDYQEWFFFCNLLMVS